MCLIKGNFLIQTNIYFILILIGSLETDREILAIKVATSGPPGHEKPVIPFALQASLEQGLYQYLASNPVCKDDPNRHKSCQYNKPSNNAASRVRPGGPANPPPKNSGTSHNIHAYTAAQSDAKINNIKLSHGPADAWGSGRARTQALNQFLHIIKPLSTLLEGVFEVVAPESFHIYKKVFKALPKNDANKGQKDCFGIWTSRGIVLDTFTDVHLDLKDVCKGFCAVVPLGKFEGGYFCLPSLGISIPVAAGMLNSILYNIFYFIFIILIEFLYLGEVLFLKSHLIPHYVGHWTGHRFSLVHYTHQVVFDFVEEKKGGEPIIPLEEMPVWYRKRMKK